VRVGLGFIRDWSEETASAVVTERVRGGPFRGIGDFVRRAPPRLKRNAIEHLVWVGGCDAFGLTRRELLWQVGLWLPPEAEQGGEARGRRQLELALDHPGEPLLWVRGKLAKDDGTVNVLAEAVQSLRLKRGSSRDSASAAEAAGLPADAEPRVHSRTQSPYAFIKFMRQVAPESKDWG